MVSGQCLGFNLVFNIPLVKPDAGVPINIPHGYPLFVSQLLSSVLWQFVTGLVIRFQAFPYTDSFLFWSFLFTFFIYKSWLFPPKVRLFQAMDWISRGDSAFALLVERSSLNPPSILVAIWEESKGMNHISRERVSRWDAVLISLPCTLKESFSFCVIRQNGGFICEANWSSFYRGDLIYWTFILLTENVIWIAVCGLRNTVVRDLCHINKYFLAWFHQWHSA